jgi:hypothetical protein
MTYGSASPPAGYETARVGGAEVVARRDALAAVTAALGRQTLHEYAARHPTARRLEGRIAAFAAPLPDSKIRVVVRHSHHGGLAAPLTGDRFLPPTRAPRELATAVRLASLGVLTPPIIAYVVYRAGWLRRSDVATLEIGGGADLAALLAGTAQAVPRADALAAAAALLRAMARAGVHHPDLNLKNILVASNVGGLATAYLLDVDRVRIRGSPARSIGSANASRLARSAKRWRDRLRAPITTAEMASLESAARGETA